MTYHRNYAHPDFVSKPASHIRPASESLALKRTAGVLAAALMLAIAAFAVVFVSVQPSVASLPTTTTIPPSAQDRKPASLRWVQLSIESAADESHGYSFDTPPMEPDAFCTSFVCHSLASSGVPQVSEAAFDRASEKLGYDKPARYENLSAQMEILEELGFAKEKFDAEKLPAMPIGTLLYACRKKTGTPVHVEFYIGNYDLNETDSLGNPRQSDSGTPLTLGARITGRDPETGDQLQSRPGCWLGGEIGAFEWNSRGEDYWDWALVPPLI